MGNTIRCVQLPLLTGQSLDKIALNHEFKYGMGKFKVDSMDGDTAIISRVASKIVRSDNFYSETPTDFSGSDDFDVRDYYNDPSVVTEKPSGGYPPYNNPQTGPVSSPGLPADVKEPAQGMSERVEIMGPSRVSERPRNRRNPQLRNEPSADDRNY